MWACDYSENTGEGKLARIFIKYIKNDNNTIKVSTPKWYLKL